MTRKNFFTTGVYWRDPRLTRNPRIWWAYLCWCLSFQMSRIGWWEPLWLCRWRIKRGDRMGRRHIKPLQRPWNALLNRITRQQMGLSHRCEFTDREQGALYTGKMDPYMERMFQRFIDRISGGGPEGEPGT